MTDAPPTEKKPRSKRMHVYWGVALTVLLGAAMLSWLVIPILQTGSIVLEYAKAASIKLPTQREPDRDAAVKTLGGPKAAVRRIRRYIRWPNWIAWCKDEAVWLLGGCGEEGADALADILQNAPHAEQRAAAALALYWMRHPPPSAVPALAHALEDSAAEVRSQTARALGRHGPGAAIAVPRLTQRLTDSSESVRRSSTWALGAIGPSASESLPALKKCLADGDGNVRKSAGRAIWRITGKNDVLVATLCSLLVQGRGIPRDRVCAEIARLGPAASGAVPSLVKALNDKDPMVQIGACEALGAIGREAKAAVPALEEKVAKSILQVGDAAKGALKKIRGAPTGLYSDQEAERFKEALVKMDFAKSKAQIYESLGLDTSRLPMGFGGTTGWTSVVTRELSPSYVLRDVTGGTFENGATIRIDRKQGK